MRQTFDTLRLFCDAGVPDGRGLEFVRFQAGDRAAYGFLLSTGLVLDTGLRRRVVDKVRPVDFARYVARNAARPAGPVIETCVLAYWAHARGWPVLADAMVAVLPQKGPALADGVLAELFRRQLRVAVVAAYNGASFVEVAERWIEVARLERPPGFAGSWTSPLAARAIAQQFRAMHRNLPPSGRLPRLIFQLRDTRMHITAWGNGPRAWFGPPKDPARMLLEAGWDAFPLLAGAIDDGRPTRGYRRNMGQKAWRPLTVREIATELLYALTGVRFHDATAARRWVRQTRLGGRAPFYLRLLRRAPNGRIRCRAVRELLQVDAKRWMPIVLDTARTQRVYGAAMLNAAEPFAGPRHGDDLRLFLKSPKPWIRLAAVRVLHRRCEDTKSVADFIRECAGKGPRRPDRSASAIAFLCEIDRRDATEVVLQLLRDANRDVRYWTADAAWKRTDGDVFKALLVMLTDSRPTGRGLIGANKPLLSRDVAARSLKKMLQRLGFSAHGDVAAYIARHDAEILARIRAPK